VNDRDDRMNVALEQQRSSNNKTNEER
jgi:hypothetical protein